MCAKADDSTNSPDLGPPPVSRYVDEDIVKKDHPINTAEKAKPSKEVEKYKQPENPAPIPKLDYQRKPPSNPEPTKEPDTATVKAPRAEKAADLAQVTVPTVRAGAKRKFGDENESLRMSKPQLDKENTALTGETVKGLPGRDHQKTRNIKELPAGRRERAAGGRTPLSAKSTNEDVSSPKKSAKTPAAIDSGKPTKPQPRQIPMDVLPKVQLPVAKPIPPVIDIPVTQLPAAEVIVTTEPE